MKKTASASLPSSALPQRTVSLRVLLHDSTTCYLTPRLVPRCVRFRRFSSGALHLRLFLVSIFFCFLVLTPPALASKSSFQCQRILLDVLPVGGYDIRLPVVKGRVQTCPNCWLLTPLAFYENLHFIKTGKRMPLSLTRAYLSWLAEEVPATLAEIRDSKKAEKFSFSRGAPLEDGFELVADSHFVSESAFESAWTGREHLLLKRLSRLIKRFQQEPNRRAVFEAYQSEVLNLIFDQSKPPRAVAAVRAMPRIFSIVEPSDFDRSNFIESERYDWPMELWKGTQSSLEHKLNPSEIDRAIIESLNAGYPVPMILDVLDQHFNNDAHVFVTPAEFRKASAFSFEDARKGFLHYRAAIQKRIKHAVLIIGAKVDAQNRLERLIVQDGTPCADKKTSTFSIEAGYFHIFMQSLLIPLRSK